MSVLARYNTLLDTMVGWPKTGRCVGAGLTPAAIAQLLAPASCGRRCS